MKTYTKYPYRVEFPDSSESGRSCQTLEDALQWASWSVHSKWRETNVYGVEGEYVHDCDRAIITNRNTGYRWIVRRGDGRVEFQTPEMLEDTVAIESIDLFLTVEEAEALARAAISADLKDKRAKALVHQALDQIGVACRRVRERLHTADEYSGQWARGIPRTMGGEETSRSNEGTDEQPTDDEDDSAEPAEETPAAPRRELVSLKEAARILGKSRGTLYAWHRAGKFPPAVQLDHGGRGGGPQVVVPLYRLEAWQAGERMPAILQEVFEFHSLHEPPWVCLTVRKRAHRDDVDFWIDRRKLKAGLSKDGKRIYGEDLEEDRRYELFE